MPAFIYRHQVLRLRHERRIRRGHPPARCLVRRIGSRSLNNFAHARHRRRHDSVPLTRDAPALLRSHEQRIHAGKYKEADDCGLHSSCWPFPAACCGLARRSDALRQHHPALPADRRSTQLTSMYEDTWMHPAGTSVPDSVEPRTLTASDEGEKRVSGAWRQAAETPSLKCSRGAAAKTVWFTVPVDTPPSLLSLLETVFDQFCTENGHASNDVCALVCALCARTLSSRGSMPRPAFHGHQRAVQNCWCSWHIVSGWPAECWGART